MLPGIVLIGLMGSGCKKNKVTVAIEQVSVGTSDNLYDVVFSDTLHGYIVGGSRYTSSALLATADGGQSWSLTQMPADGNKAVYAVAVKGSRLMAAGFDGKLFRYDAGMLTWSYTQTNWWEWLQGISFASEQYIYVVGGIGYRNGRILKADVQGHVVQADSFDFELNDIQFVSEQTGYACGYGAVLKTTDGGVSWQQLAIKGDFFKALACPTEQEIWSVGYNGSIIHSTDGGTNWERLRNGDNPLQKRLRFRDISFRNSNEGIAVGDAGLIYQTKDGGSNWQQIDNQLHEDLHAVAWQPGGSVWIVGATGIILRLNQ